MKRAELEQRLGEDHEVETYNTWLRRQPFEVQDRILGRVRAARFRAGKLSVTRWTDHGGPLTLEQLASRAG